jgi:CubicO group peptidase (beta-lactamase class C family)
MVVGLTQGGRHSSFAYGFANAMGRTLDENAVFEIGSITKLFTALLLADMVHRGEAALDEPVAALLPPGTRVPNRNGKPITLLHLASHTSGLPRLPSDILPVTLEPYVGYTAERLYAFLAGHKLARTPGEGFEYSNLGAGLLRHALGLRAGQDYERLVATRILQPLGMSSTAIHLSPALGTRFASGHDDSGEPLPAWDFSVLAGAGGLRSTAPDMLLFLDALMDGTGPLAPAAALLAASRDAGGLGFGLPQPDGRVALQHEGGTGGFRSYAGCVPAWRRGAVVLANASTGACGDLGIHLCDPRWALHWFRQPIAVDPACFDRLLGRYRMRPGLLFDVTRNGDRLMVQLTGQAALRVFPLSEWHFFYKVVGAQVTFDPGPDGRAARLILHQNSRDQAADRIEG